MDSPALRDAYEAALPLITDFQTDLTQTVVYRAPAISQQYRIPDTGYRQPQ